MKNIRISWTTNTIDSLIPDEQEESEELNELKRNFEYMIERDWDYRDLGGYNEK